MLRLLQMRTAATSKIELFVIIVNSFQSLTIITECSILDVAAVLDPPLYYLFKCGNGITLSLNNPVGNFLINNDIMSPSCLGTITQEETNVACPSMFSRISFFYYFNIFIGFNFSVSVIDFMEFSHMVAWSEEWFCQCEVLIQNFQFSSAFKNMAKFMNNFTYVIRNSFVCTVDAFIFYVQTF